MGFKQAAAEHFLFTRGSRAYFVALLVNVDDVVVVSSDRAQIIDIKSHLHATFHIKELVHLKFFFFCFFELEVARNTYGINIYQWKYV